MQCPKCGGPIGRKDMLAPLAWSSFACPGCKAHLDATKVSQSLIIVLAGVLSTLIAWLVDVAGLGGMASISVGCVTF